MKLDRNINADGRGKYAIIQLRKLKDFIQPDDPLQRVAEPIATAIDVLERAGLIDWGMTGTDREFFLIRLKDQYAMRALFAYSAAASDDGNYEYADEILEMANRSGNRSPFCKKPD